MKLSVQDKFKTQEFLERSPLSGAGKHTDFQVRLCLQNVSTNVDFAYVESETMSVFSENTDIFQ